MFRYFLFKISNAVDSNVIEFKNLFFFCKNYLIKYRIDTLRSKEPETIEWIENFNKDDIFLILAQILDYIHVMLHKKVLEPFLLSHQFLI